MLKRVQIKNYRSCRDVTLEGLGHITALVGRNASGKTNILSAIDQFARMATAIDLSSVFWRLHSPGRPVPQFSCELSLGASSYRYTLGAGLEPIDSSENQTLFQLSLKESLAVCSGSDRWEHLLTRSNQELRVAGRSEPVALGTATPALPAVHSLFPDATGLLQHVGPLLAFLRATRYYPFEERNEVSLPDRLTFIADADYQQWVTQFRAGEAIGDSVLMRLLYAHYENKKLLEEIRAVVGPQGIDLIQGITFNTLKVPSELHGKETGQKETKLHLVRFRPGGALGGGRDHYNLDQLSLGTRRVLRILVSLVVDGSSLMLIEHPEDGIHSGLLKKLMGLLRANADPAQIILSSHAADVFNTLRAEDLRLVTARRGLTSVRSLTAHQVESAARFINEDGSLAEFLESVEGD